MVNTYKHQFPFGLSDAKNDNSKHGSGQQKQLQQKKTANVNHDWYDNDNDGDPEGHENENNGDPEGHDNDNDGDPEGHDNDNDASLFCLILEIPHMACSILHSSI